MSLLVQCPEGQRLTLEPEVEIVVGAGSDCAVSLRGNGVPAQLALLSREFGEAWLRVLAPEPPVAVNGRPVRSLSRLYTGDRICFGAFCVDLLGSEPAAASSGLAIDSYVLRIRGGAGGGSLLAGPVLHLDADTGEPVSAAASQVGLTLSGGRLQLDPGAAQVRVNGWPLADCAVLAPGDQIQIGQRRYQVETIAAPAPEADSDTVSEVESGRPANAGKARTQPDQYGLWWLIGLAAIIAGVVSALLYFRA